MVNKLNLPTPFQFILRDPFALSWRVPPFFWGLGCAVIVLCRQPSFTSSNAYWGKNGQLM
jgi:hypothetical protein